MIEKFRPGVKTLVGLLLGARANVGGDRNVKNANVLLVRVGTTLCAIPLPSVREVLRPLVLKQCPAVPGYVEGATVVRGEAVPVLSLAALLGQEAAPSSARWVLIEVGGYRVVWSVTSVIGVVPFDSDDLDRLPPVLGDGKHGLIESLGVRDRELFFVLRAVKGVPAELWQKIAEAVSL